MDELFSTLYLLSHIWNVASLSYHYFHGECLGELHFLVTPTVTLLFKTCHVICIEMNHHHSHCIALVMNKFHLDSFFPSIVALWNRIPERCFLNHNNLQGLSIIFPTYLYKMYLLLLLLTQQ